MNPEFHFEIGAMRGRRGTAGREVAPLLAGLAVAIAVLAAGTLAGTLEDTPLNEPVIATHYGLDFAACESVPAVGCELAPAGANWSVQPVSSWCSFNTTEEEGLNGSYSTTEVECGESSVGFEIDLSTNLTLSGIITASGPLQAWIFPVEDGCQWEITVTHIEHLCPAYYGPPPAYGMWNSTPARTGTVDLASLGFDFAGRLGVLPTGFWDLELVALGSQSETITAGSALLASPL